MIRQAIAMPLFLTLPLPRKFVRSTFARREPLSQLAVRLIALRG